MRKVCKLTRQCAFLYCGNWAPQYTSEILLVASFPFHVTKNIESFELTDNFRYYDIRYIVFGLVVPDLIQF